MIMVIVMVMILGWVVIGKMLKTKKTQVTIFIILGLVLLLMVSILIYSIAIQRKVIEREPVVEEIPLWAESIKLYVEECIKEKTVEALKKIGEHGGYIDMNDEDLSGRSFDIDVTKPTESDGVSLSTAVNEPIAYWWYLSSPNNCVDCYVSSLAPSIEGIENQINRFINKELDKCLGDFAEFKEQGYEFDKGEINTNTIISNVSDGGVNVFVDYPIEVSRQKIKIDLEEFKARIPLNLNEMLRVATSITIDEMDNQSLEKILNYMISAFSGIDVNKLPPIADVDHKYYTITWIKGAVELNLKDNILTPNTNWIRVNQTKNWKDYGDAYKIYSLNSLEYPTDLEAEFFYLGWPMYFDITPRSGNILRPNTDTWSDPIGILPPTQTNYYEFFYDVSYPVVVMLTDDRGEVNVTFKDGYKFMFALETNIRDNINLLNWHLGHGTIGSWDYGDVDVNVSESVDVPLPPTISLMGNPQQRLSGDIEIMVEDNKENIPVEGAAISFGCGRYDSVPIGATDGEGVYRGKFPLCMGGYLRIEKEGYMVKAMLLTTEFGKDDSKTVSLEPYREFKVNAKVYRMTKQDDCCPGATELTSDEQIILMINKYRDDEVYGQMLTQGFVFDENNEEQTIKLVPGQYEVTITYVDNDQYEIPAKCKHICQTIVGCHTDDSWDYSTNTPISNCPALCLFGCCDAANEWVPEEPFNMTSVGGAIFDETTGYLYLSKSDLDSGNENIEFYAIRVPDATCIDDDCVLDECIGMDEMGKIEDYSKDFRDDLKPRFY